VWDGLPIPLPSRRSSAELRAEAPVISPGTLDIVRRVVARATPSEDLTEEPSEATPSEATPSEDTNDTDKPPSVY
jgi:hypothetical protein